MSPIVLTPLIVLSAAALAVAVIGVIRAVYGLVDGDDGRVVSGLAIALSAHFVAGAFAFVAGAL